jgi:cytochrome c553
MRKIMKWIGIVLGSLIGLAFLAGVVLYPIGLEKLTRSYSDIPIETVDIPTGPAAAARGRHIAIVWECTKCHGEDLSGKLVSNDPIMGTIPAANLTSGKGGVAASYTDVDWVRAIRHGVKPNGQVEIYMHDYYSTMIDRDWGDLIAYLQQIPPVDSNYPAMQLGPIIPIATAVGLLTPAAELIDHSAPRPTAPVPGATVEYGKYLSAICFHCHSPNLASKLEKWKQADFVNAVRTGVLPNGKKFSHAKFLKTFEEMNDMELTALWLYLQSLSPAKPPK